MAAEYDDSGSLIAEYHYTPGLSWMTAPVYQRRGGQVVYYINDHLGTPMRLVARNGATVWQADYSAFGRLTSETATIPNPLRFPGQYHDRETGLYHNYMRDYDPALGRYLQRDPIGLAGGLNVYGYAYQNPVNYYDPYGLWSWGDPLPQWMVDGAAGFGDTLSFGVTDWIRSQLNINGVVNKCSGAYSAGEWAGIGIGLAFSGGTLGRHALANGWKSIIREKRTFQTISRRWHRRFPNGGMINLDHMFISRRIASRLGIKNINIGLNLVPISKRLNQVWLNPNNFFWTRKHRLFGKFVPQSLRTLFQSGTAGLWGARPPGLYVKLQENVSVDKL
ncbi:RHS repeat-associated core domain-containing protein [Hahella sp. SMD15-11]|uniref:RHS repeat-associated core domain-containing protein n=1 Tax=Thermohahella caldifontis TaxID=3142973 RepID=A0AB39UVB8_9GAMM